MELTFVELRAGSARAQATSEALERSHRQLNPDLQQAQRLELLARFNDSVFCCPDHSTKGFCSVGRIRALEGLRDLAVQVFPRQPTALLGTPLQSIAQAVAETSPGHGPERWLRQYQELRQVLRFLGDKAWLQRNCARWTLPLLANNLSRAGCYSVWGRKLHLLGLTQHLVADNTEPLRDDVLLWGAARTFLREMGQPPRPLPVLQLPQSADVLRWAHRQLAAKLYDCREECLRSAAVLGRAASLQELYLSQVCSSEDLWTSAAMLRSSGNSSCSHALHVLCLSSTAHSAWAAVDNLLATNPAPLEPVQCRGSAQALEDLRPALARFCERESDSLHEVLQTLGDEAGVAGTPRWDQPQSAAGGLVTSVLLRQLLFQFVPDVTALPNADESAETLWCARPELPQRYDKAVFDFCRERNLRVLDEYRRVAAAAHALGDPAVPSLQTLAAAAAARVYARPVLLAEPNGNGAHQRPAADWEGTSGRLLQRSLEQRQLLVRALCVLGIICYEARRGRELKEFRQLWDQAIHAYDRVQLSWIALASARSSSRRVLEDTCESDYQTLFRLCETLQPPQIQELWPPPRVLGGDDQNSGGTSAYRDWLHNHTQLARLAEALVQRARQNYARLSRFALTRCGWVLPMGSVPSEPPGQSVDEYLGWLRQAGLVELVNQELQEILSRA